MQRHYSIINAVSHDGRDTSANGSAEFWKALLVIYRAMFMARCVDEAENNLVGRGEAFFHIPGQGHEGSAVVYLELTDADWLHLHYRDKALMLARGLTPESFLHSLLCNSQSHSSGRQMTEMMSSRPLRIMSTPTLVGNSALQAVGVASVIKNQAGQPIVVCSVGDGGTQQGEVLEAIAEAARSELPVLFFIEDNGYSISTRTGGRTFFSLSASAEMPDQFFGLPIHRLDGRDVVACTEPLCEIVHAMRLDRRPAIVVFKVERKRAPPPLIYPAASIDFRM